MFDFLKKKITGFVDKLTKKEEDKEGKEVVEEEIAEEKPEEKVIEKPKHIPKEPTKAPKPIPKEKAPIPKKEKAKAKTPSTKKVEKEIEIPESVVPESEIEIKEPKPKEEKPKKEKPIPKPKEKTPIPKKEKAKAKKESKIEKAESVISEPEILEPEPETGDRELETEILEPEIPERETRDREPETEHIEPEPETPRPETIEEKPEVPEEKPALPQYKEEKEKKKGISLSPFKAIKSFITQQVEISESDVHELLENLELELLEADVELSVAEKIRVELADKLVGSKVKKKELDSFIKNVVRDTLIELMSSEKSFDLLELIQTKEKPLKIVFFGLNGTGKTTTIAKVAHLLMQNNHKVVFAAADTFRAAAIEQMEVHANRLEVKIIKRDYGADPTSVGYDAVSYAKAHGIDAVLIDTAGRQDTNINLINELKKMDRVLQPDLKLYVGESIAGSSMIEQVSTFNNEIGIDGVILTKLDCDPKGGTILSITKATGIPVVYIGVGQKYEDLEPFDPEKIVDRVLS
jgi:fused signal recognition particle receptor